MQIAGIQKNTLVDYPGKIACVVFTPGCNFRCPFCHNPEMVLPENVKLFGSAMITEEAVFNFLDTRKGFMDGVSICGGEPTLQKDLYEFISKIKEKGFLVKLDTNGRDAMIVEKLLKTNMIDYLAVDLKHALYSYTSATGVENAPAFFHNYERLLQLLLDSKIDYEYRTTVIKGMHDKDDILAMSQYIRGAKNYYLQNYIGGNTLDPNFGGESFSEDELHEFKSIAEQYVDHVGIRK